MPIFAIWQSRAETINCDLLRDNDSSDCAARVGLACETELQRPDWLSAFTARSGTNRRSVGNAVAQAVAALAATQLPDAPGLREIDELIGRLWAGERELCVLRPSGSGKSSLVAAGVMHRGVVTSAAFSPDGTRVVTASDDGTARVWNAATGKPLGPSLTHQDAVSSAAFSPDGTRVVTASDDKTARVWQIPLDDTPWEVLAARCPCVVTGGAIERRVPLTP